MGLDLRFGQVSCNFENVQNLAVLHGFIIESLFSFHTNMYLIIRRTNLQDKFMGLELCLDLVSWNSEDVQNLDGLHGVIKESLFPF